MAKVSILMNGYNSEKYLKEAIDSVYAQTFEDWEIILIDNCSIDDTKNIVHGYDKKIKYYKTEKNIPLGAARNFGLTKCNGEYLAFLDTDDVWLEDKLTKQIVFMDQNIDYQMCYGGVIYINENSEKIGIFLPKAKSGNVFPMQLRRYEVNMQSVLIRNNIDISFSEEMHFSPDFDLFMNITSIYKCGVLSEYLVKYRKLENSLTSQKIDRWWIETKQTLDNIFKKHAELKKRYSKEHKLAYAKVAYYKACYLISIGKYNKVTGELSKYKFIDIKYFLLYLVSLFPQSVWDFAHRYK